MATAALRERRRQPKAARPQLDNYEANRSDSLFMPAGSMSLEEFRQWTYSDEFPETGKIAYIGNEVFIDMSPERLRSHGSVKTEVCGVVHRLVRKRKSGKFYMDRARIANVPAGVSNEPDALFAFWKSFKSGKIRFVPTKDGDDYIELEGACDWILEIVSPGSDAKDKNKLRTCYHRAGIDEYWLIDARGEDVDFQILIRGEDGYKATERVGPWQASKVFGKKFRLRRIKDELGDVDFRLDMK